jgi:integrase
VRSLLVEHGALPSRDEKLARFQSWAITAQQRITTEEHRKVLARYIRWGLEKRLRSMNLVTDSAFLRAKQTVTVTIEFCNWLAAEHDTTVEQVTQAHIDLWQSTGPATREHILRFIRWAIKARLVASDLEVTPHRRGTAPRLSTEQQNAVIEQVVHQQTHHPRDRFAAILMIVFAQRAEDVAALTWSQVRITADIVTVDLAGLP